MVMMPMMMPMMASGDGDLDDDHDDVEGNCKKEMILTVMAGRDVGRDRSYVSCTFCGLGGLCGADDDGGDSRMVTMRMTVALALD